jgi:hypothetical protein
MIAKGFCGAQVTGGVQGVRVTGGAEGCRSTARRVCLIRRAVTPDRAGLPDLTAVSWSGQRARSPDLLLRLL